MQGAIFSSLALLVSFSFACGGSSYRPYDSKEVSIESRAASFNHARGLMQSHGLRLLEESLEMGVLSSQWERFEGQDYQVRVIMSPVSSAVEIGCRVQRGLNLEKCNLERGFPSHLVSKARKLTRKIALRVSGNAGSTEKALNDS